MLPFGFHCIKSFSGICHFRIVFEGEAVFDFPKTFERLKLRMEDREIVADRQRLAQRFGQGDPEAFYYRREFLNQESEVLIEKSLGIFENGGSDYQRKMRLLRCADNVPDGGRPKVVREYFDTVDQIENSGGGFSLLQTGQYCLGMRDICVRPRDTALSLALGDHYEKCSNRLSYCHLCSALWSATSGENATVGILSRAQVSTRRIERISPGVCRVLGSDTNSGNCKRVRTEDTVLLHLPHKKLRRSDFGLSKKVFLEDRSYGNEVIADCK